MSQPQANVAPAKVSQWWKVKYLLPLIVAVVVLLTHFFFYKKFLYCSNSPCSPFTAAEIASSVAPADQTTKPVQLAPPVWVYRRGKAGQGFVKGVR